MTEPTYAELIRLARLVADTGYDGRPCSHDEGCHDHEECRENDRGCALMDGDCGCPVGPCCDSWYMGGDEEHQNLVDLVLGAKATLGSAGSGISINPGINAAGTSRRLLS